MVLSLYIERNDRMDMLKIMIVDDAAFMRRVLRMILEDLGHQIIAEAANGLEAVQMYRIVKPDLVTLDITMPEMDGISALKEILKFDSAAKVIMCSAMGQRHLIMEAIRSGASDFVVKPVQRERVLQAINYVFDMNLNRVH